MSKYQNKFPGYNLWPTNERNMLSLWLLTVSWFVNTTTSSLGFDNNAVICHSNDLSISLKVKVNSLVLGRCICNFTLVIFNLLSGIDILSISCWGNGPRWCPAQRASNAENVFKSWHHPLNVMEHLCIIDRMTEGENELLVRHLNLGVLKITTRATCTAGYLPHCVGNHH